MPEVITEARSQRVARPAARSDLVCMRGGDPRHAVAKLTRRARAPSAHAALLPRNSVKIVHRAT
jgi:hypothetical protein